MYIVDTTYIDEHNFVITDSYVRMDDRNIAFSECKPGLQNSLKKRPAIIRANPLL